MVTGVDLVQWQLRIARGERLTLTRDDTLVPRGHAIECRIYAEDPDRGFLPSPGRITSLSVPGGTGIRDDSGVAPGFEVPVYYDSLLSKLVAWADTREHARRRMLRALGEYRVGGIHTTLPFFRWMLQHDAFIAAEVDTSFLDAELRTRAGEPFTPPPPDAADLAVMATALDAWFQAAGGAAASTRAGTPPTSRWGLAARQAGLRR
jgi:acetyl-CoA carboxylase, biotin carboxylase subunit